MTHKQIQRDLQFLWVCRRGLIDGLCHILAHSAGRHLSLPQIGSDLNPRWDPFTGPLFPGRRLFNIWAWHNNAGRSEEGICVYP